MASACVNNVTLLPSSYDCFSPRISFSLDFPDNVSDPTSNDNPDSDPDFIDFEFHHLKDDPLAMLPADELFSDGKLVPLHLAPIKSTPYPDPLTDETRTLDTPRKPAARREDEILIGSGPDSFAVSPKAPTCSSRWRELLRLKRQQQQQALNSDPVSKNPNPRSLKHFLLNRNSRSHPGQTLQLLRDSEPEPLSISSRLSLSSSSGPVPEPDELPRLSLDSENKPNKNPILLNRNPPKARRSSARARRSPVRRAAAEQPERCSSVDSPRMNASGKVVFQGLGRSSSSPSTFNGGPRSKNHHHQRHRGMERSYSANVRVTPVLNLPVCPLRGGSKSGSVFGFGQLFSGSGSGPKVKN